MNCYRYEEKRKFENDSEDFELEQSRVELPLHDMK